VPRIAADSFGTSACACAAPTDEAKVNKVTALNFLKGSPSIRPPAATIRAAMGTIF